MDRDKLDKIRDQLREDLESAMNDYEYQLEFTDKLAWRVVEVLQMLDVPLRDICNRLIYARDDFQEIGTAIFACVVEAFLNGDEDITFSMEDHVQTIAYILYDEVHLLLIDKPIDQKEMDKFSKMAEDIIRRVAEDMWTELDEAVAEI